MLAEPDKYSYYRFGSRGQRVGQAVIDIMSKPQPIQTVGDTLDAFGADYAKEIEKCIEENKGKYKNPFYIFILTKKEFWTNNVIRNFFIARQTPPHAFKAMEEYSTFTKTLYIVDASRGNIKTLWSLPSFDDCIEIARHPLTYDPELVKWVEECFNLKMEKDSYSFDWGVWQ